MQAKKEPVCIQKNDSGKRCPRLKAFLSLRIHIFHSGADTRTLRTEAELTAKVDL